MLQKVAPGSLLNSHNLVHVVRATTTYPDTILYVIGISAIQVFLTLHILYFMFRVIYIISHYIYRVYGDF